MCIRPISGAADTGLADTRSPAPVEPATDDATDRIGQFVSGSADAGSEVA